MVILLDHHGGTPKKQQAVEAQTGACMVRQFTMSHLTICGRVLSSEIWPFDEAVVYRRCDVCTSHFRVQHEAARRGCEGQE